MCGIAGVLELRPDGVARRERLQRMIRTLAHRGPDGYGYFERGPVGLAHARLSIIDLATGDQPMSNEDGSVWVVFNGEIFNYLELRKTLEGAGHVFRSHSDTETIVHAYEEYGDEFVHRLNGQFAIALWDERRRRLVLVRDRVGIRPLYYRADATGVVFASEIKAILAQRAERAALDVKGLAQVFTFWSTVGSRTAFAGINALPPGHMLSFEAGSQSLRRYWDWSMPPRGECRRLSLGEAAEELRSLLADAVRLQLRADVPVGGYLSGGLDSSGIVALARSQQIGLRTFSVTFGDAEYDESAYQRTVSQYLASEHATINCDTRAIGELFPKLIWHTECPIVRTAPVPLMMLSSLVHRSGMKVVLTGEGADEAFAGYDLFKEGAIRRFWARQPQSKGRPALFERLYPYLKHSPVANRSFAMKFFGQQLADTQSPYYAHLTRWATAGRLWNCLSERLRTELQDYRPVDELGALLPTDFERWHPLGRDQWVEAHTLLSGYLLSSQGDRVAMANSVEARVPYLDHRVIEFANQLSPTLKLRGLTEKAVLREALRPLLPAEVVNRIKQPYRAPDSASFFHGGVPLDYVNELFSVARLREADLFDANVVSQLFEKCRRGRAIGFADNMAFVGVLSAMLLEEQFVRAAPA